MPPKKKQKQKQPPPSESTKPPYDIPKATKAMQAKKVHDKFIAERKAAVCRASDPKLYDKKPETFVYTNDHCHPRSKATTASSRAQSKRKGSAATDRSRLDDKKEIKALNAIISKKYTPKERQHMLNKNTTGVNHVLVTATTGMMLLPFYRSKYPDPEERYGQILDKLKLEKGPDFMFSVLYQSSIILSALNSGPNAQNIGKL